MTKKLMVICLLAIMATAAYAQTPLLGTAQLSQSENKTWFFEARAFDRDDAVADWEANRSYSVGWTGPINDKTDFSLIYSNQTSEGELFPGGPYVWQDNEVLSPTIKRLISGANSSSKLAFSIGCDVEVRDGGFVTDTGIDTEADGLVPAAKLQLEMGDPGEFQWQLAAMVGFFDSGLAAPGGAIPYYGTLTCVGGGVSVPVSLSLFRGSLSGKLVLIGDVLVPVDGDNSFNENTGMIDDEVVWSAGGRWEFDDRWNSSVSLFATNSTGPTLATTMLASPENEIGVGLCYGREF